jgi:hypothetical protein
MGHPSIEEVRQDYRRVLAGWADQVGAKEAVRAFGHLLKAGESDPHGLFQNPALAEFGKHLDETLPGWAEGPLPSEFRAVLGDLTTIFQARVINQIIAYDRGEPAPVRWLEPGVWTVRLGDVDDQTLSEVREWNFYSRNTGAYICLVLEEDRVDGDEVCRWFDTTRAAIGDLRGAFLAPRLAAHKYEFDDDLRRRLAARYVLLLDAGDDALEWDEPERMIRQVLERERRRMEATDITELLVPFRPVHRAPDGSRPAKPPSPFDVFPAHADPQVFSDWIDSLRPDWYRPDRPD